MSDYLVQIERAVYIPTPGNSSNLSSELGMIPLYFSKIICADSNSLLARKKDLKILIEWQFLPHLLWLNLEE